MTEAISLEERRAKYAVPALEKGLDLLEHLSAQATPMTQAQLARALGRQPSELFRMLTCLELRGYLRRDPASGGYVLTLKLYELSRTHSPYEDLLKAAQPLMRALSDDIGESCHLSVIHRDGVLVLAQEESPRAFRLSVEVGSVHAPVTTTSGRLLLAYMDPAARADLLAGQPEWSRLDAKARAAFAARLNTIRTRGFEHTDGERFVGAMDIGVLVGSAGSSIHAALTVAALKEKDGPDLTPLLPRLAACAAEITAVAGLDMGDAAT